MQNHDTTEGIALIGRFIEAVEITRAQNHILTAAVLALASEAKPETRELAAMMVETALETLPPSYQMAAETAAKLSVAGVVLGSTLAAALRTGAAKDADFRQAQKDTRPDGEAARVVMLRP